MARNNNNASTDLRGAANLTTDAIVGVTNLVESLHYSIAANAVQADRSEPLRTRGITGLVYRNIRGVTRAVGGGLDLLLGQIGTTLGDQDSPPARETLLAVLNGVLGDYLVAHNNPLAVPMQFRLDGQTLDEQALAEAVQLSRGKLLIMVHGLCMNDLQWFRRGHDHGAALAQDMGFAPLYLYYNSGRHISENGRLLANLLESTIQQADQPLELVMIGFSMGGLVARSACYYGQRFGHRWLSQLDKLIFLATPHHGALLERGGNWIDSIFRISNYSAPFSRLGKIRSSGLTDLRYGNVISEDWQGRDRFQLAGDQRSPVPLPADAKCYAIAATRSAEPNKLGDHVVGDGLVSVDSALGLHKDAAMNLSIPDSRTWVGRKMSHLDLLNHPQVYETIKRWVENE